MRGISKQLTILEKEAREELRLREERDSLGGLVPVLSLRPLFCFPEGKLAVTGSCGENRKWGSIYSFLRNLSRKMGGGM